MASKRKLQNAESSLIEPKRERLCEAEIVAKCEMNESTNYEYLVDFVAQGDAHDDEDPLAPVAQEFFKTEVKSEDDDTNVEVEEDGTEVEMEEDDTEVNVEEDGADVKMEEDGTYVKVEEDDTNVKVEIDDTNVKVEEDDTDVDGEGHDTEVKVEEDDSEVKITVDDTNVKVEEEDSNVNDQDVCQSYSGLTDFWEPSNSAKTVGPPPALRKGIATISNHETNQKITSHERSLGMIPIEPSSTRKYAISESESGQAENYLALTVDHNYAKTRRMNPVSRGGTLDLNAVVRTKAYLFEARANQAVFPRWRAGFIPKINEKNGDSSLVDTAECSPVSVSMLLAHPLATNFWSTDQRRSVLLQPIPLSEFDQQYVEFFDFSKFPWLCDLPERKKFFCWPCLLSSTSLVWSAPVPSRLDSQSAVDFKISLKEHEATPDHLQAEFQYNFTKTESCLHSCHNTWKKFVKAVCYEREKNDDFQPEDNPDFSAKMLDITKPHLSESIPLDKVARLSRLIVGIATFKMRNAVVSEVRKAQYVALHVQDLSNIVVDRSWLAVIARYVDQKGCVYERVISFVRYLSLAKPQSRSATIASNLLHPIIMHLSSKVVGFSYSPSIVAPSEVPAFHQCILEWCPNALFYHSPCESLHASLYQAITHGPTCNEYFRVANELCDFLNTHRTIVTTIENSSTFVAHSTLPKKFDSDFPAIIGRHLSTLFEVLRKMGRFTEYGKLGVQRFIRFLLAPHNRILILVVTEVFTIVSGFADSLERQIETNLLMQEHARCIAKLTEIKEKGPKVIEHLSKDANMQKMAHDLPHSYNGIFGKLVDGVIDSVVAFLAHRFANLEQIHYTSSNILNSTLKTVKQYAHEDSMVRAQLNESEIIQMKSLLYETPPFLENKTLSEALTFLIEENKATEFSGLHQYLLFLRTMSLAGSEQRQLVQSLYHRVKKGLLNNNTESVLNGYYWQIDGQVEKLLRCQELYPDVMKTCRLNVVVENGSVKMVPIKMARTKGIVRVY